MHQITASTTLKQKPQEIWGELTCVENRRLEPSSLRSNEQKNLESLADREAAVNPTLRDVLRRTPNIYPVLHLEPSSSTMHFTAQTDTFRCTPLRIKVWNIFTKLLPLSGQGYSSFTFFFLFLYVFDLSTMNVYHIDAFQHCSFSADQRILVSWKFTWRRLQYSGACLPSLPAWGRWWRFIQRRITERAEPTVSTQGTTLCCYSHLPPGLSLQSLPEWFSSLSSSLPSDPVPAQVLPSSPGLISQPPNWSSYLQSLPASPSLQAQRASLIMLWEWT